MRNIKASKLDISHHTIQIVANKLKIIYSDVRLIMVLPMGCGTTIAGEITLKLEVHVHVRKKK